MPIDPVSHYEKQTVDVHGKRMAYVEAGDRDRRPIVFLHGNPTSSFLWRNVIPHLEPLGRCLAPDLIGMGDSEPVDAPGPGSYRFVEHRHYLDGFLAAVHADADVVLAVHDWGSALGFDWANRHREDVRGIAYMEAICGPVSFDDWPEASQRIFSGMRGEAGEELVLQKNVFVERILPASVMRDLTEVEMEEYRRPYLEPGESRRPTLVWPREIPFDGEPADTAEIIESYRRWLADAELPKLYIHAEPGFLSQVFADVCRTWPHQQEVTVSGIHFVQEDDPDAIGTALAAWVASLG